MITIHEISTKRLNYHEEHYQALLKNSFTQKKEEEAKLLFQLIDRRYEKRSTIITTNIHFSKWEEVLNDVLIANAIVDRLLHHCHVVKIIGPSYRLKNILEGEEK